MRLLQRLDEYTPLKTPLALTIGNYDGMHRGHQAVLKRLKDKGANGETVVLTFRNHPSEILRPNHPVPLLCTFEHKLKLIEEAGIDTLIAIPFTRHLARQSASYFIENLRSYLPFDQLILGHDATMGKDRRGDQDTVKQLAIKWGFDIEYVLEQRYEGRPLSSSVIRASLQQGNFLEVELLLGRPYSIYGLPEKIEATHARFQLSTPKLCLPPSGSYKAEVVSHKRVQLAQLIIQAEKHLCIIELTDPSTLPSPNEWIEVILINQMQ